MKKISIYPCSYVSLFFSHLLYRNFGDEEQIYIGPDNKECTFVLFTLCHIKISVTKNKPILAGADENKETYLFVGFYFHAYGYSILSHTNTHAR